MSTGGMTIVRRLPPGAAAATLFVLTASLLVLANVLERGNLPYTLNFRTSTDVALGATVFAMSALGVVVLAGRPKHLTGRLFLAFGGLFVIALLAHAVAVRVLLVGEGPRLLGLTAAWISSFALVPAFAVLPFVLATWPDGRIDTSWLRRLAPVVVAGAAAATVAESLSPGRLDGVARPWRLDNPLGVERLGGLTAAVTAVGVLLVVLFALAVAVDVLVRARRARGDRRRQLMPVAVLVIGVPLLTAVAIPLYDNLGWLAATLLATLVGLPGAVAFAVRGARRREAAERARAAVVQEREEERRRLRQELHDGVGPLLAALRLELDVVERQADARRAQDLLAESIAEVRRISRGLRPALLDELGLAGAVRQRVRALSAASATRWSVELPDELELEAALETAVFGIAGEAMTNVVRHSRARTARLVIRVEADRVLVEVVDDGVGVDGGRLGVGLRSMQQRAEELGGTLDLVTSPGLGTRISAALPIRTLAT